jgi:hypothetical protein
MVNIAFKKIFSDANVYTEEDIGIYKDNGNKESYGLYPDTIVIQKESIHIFDAKYKTKIDIEKDIIKQNLYVLNFLNPCINDKYENDKYEVDTNLYFVMPSKSSDKPVKFEKSDSYIKIYLDVLWLLKICNGEKVDSGKNSIILCECNLKEPNRAFKPIIPNICLDDKGNILTVENGKYKKYMEYRNSHLSYKKGELSGSIFKTKKVSEIIKI